MQRFLYVVLAVFMLSSSLQALAEETPTLDKQQIKNGWKNQVQETTTYLRWDNMAGMSDVILHRKTPVSVMVNIANADRCITTTLSMPDRAVAPSQEITNCIMCCGIFSQRLNQTVEDSLTIMADKQTLKRREILNGYCTCDCARRGNPTPNIMAISAIENLCRGL